MLSVGRRRRIPIRPDHTTCHAGSDHLILIYPVVVAELCVQFQELGKRHSHQFLLLLAERLSECAVNQRGQVTGRSHRGLPPDRVAHTAHRGVVVGVRIFHLRDELVSQTDIEGRILLLYLLEGFRRIAKHIERQLERRDAVLAGSHRLEVVGDVSAESKQLIVLGAVHLVHVDAESGGSRKVILLASHAGEDNTREGERGRQAQLVAVHQRTAVLPCLPFVGAVHLHVPSLSAAEDVVLRYGEGGTGSRLVVALHGDVEVQLGIIGFIQHGMDIHIECIRD